MHTHQGPRISKPSAEIPHQAYPNRLPRHGSTSVTAPGLMLGPKGHAAMGTAAIAFFGTSTYFFVSTFVPGKGIMNKKPYSCGLEAALEVVGGKWKPLVLWRLAPGARRFGELRRLVPGISEKMLIQQLREMEAHGIVDRKDFQEVPPRVQYSLTPFGVTLTHALKPLCNWGATHMSRIQESRAQEEATDRETVPLASDT